MFCGYLSLNSDREIVCMYFNQSQGKYKSEYVKHWGRFRTMEGRGCDTAQERQVAEASPACPDCRRAN